MENLRDEKINFGERGMSSACVRVNVCVSLCVLE